VNLSDFRGSYVHFLMTNLKSLASVKACIVDVSAKATEPGQIWDLNLDHCFPKLFLFDYASSVNFKYKLNELYENVNEW